MEDFHGKEVMVHRICDAQVQNSGVCIDGHYVLSTGFDTRDHNTNDVQPWPDTNVQLI